MNTSKRNWFQTFAKHAAANAGRPVTFCLAVGIVLVWAASGPFFGFGDTWQLVINTGTTIITFLMVFLIQNSQNRDGEALQIKLDELIRTQKSANKSLLDLEDLSQEEIDQVRESFLRIAEVHRKRAERGNPRYSAD